MVTLPYQPCGQMTFQGWAKGRGLWKACEWAQLRPPAVPALQQACLLCGCPRGLMRAALCAPFSCHMWCVMCVHVTCTSWSLSNWNSLSCSQDKNNPRPFSLKSYSAWCQVASSQPEKAWRPACSAGWAIPGPGPQALPVPQPHPCPLPAPLSLLMSRAGTATGAM